MDIREKLVELLTDNLPRIGNLPQCDNPLQYTINEIVGRIADHLIANGVMVSQWISVDDRLPEFCVSVLARCFYNGKWRTLVCHTSKEHGGEWYTDEVCQWVKVTHWMPLPELPKGE